MKKSKTSPTAPVKLSDGWVRIGTLEFGPSSKDSMTFSEAEKYAKEQGGRLPTRFELESILDITKYNPAVDKSVFPDTQSSYYWTSDKYVAYSGCRWVVGFDNGSVYYINEGIYFYVRPVRPSQC